MKRLWFLLLVPALALTACNSLNWPWTSRSAPPAQMGGSSGDLPPGGKAGLPLASQSRFPDVPLPIGLTEDKERTYVFESADIQLGRLVYKSRDSMNELAQFYLDEAQASGWKRDNIQQAGNYDIYFSKPGRRLTVSIRDLGMGRGRQLILNYNPDSGSGR